MSDAPADSRPSTGSRGAAFGLLGAKLAGHVLPQMTLPVASGTARVAQIAVEQFLLDGNGNRINLLRGAARNSAGLARLGFGTLAKGGGGMRGGDITLQVIEGAVAAGLLAASVAARYHIERNLPGSETTEGSLSS